MKKIFTLIAVALVAIVSNAETVNVDFSKLGDGVVSTSATQVDKTILAQKIAEAKEKGVKESVITSALDVYDTATATQAEVDAAVAKIQAELDNIANFATLTEQYNTAMSKSYDQLTKENLEAAYTACKNDLNVENLDVLQSLINALPDQAYTTNPADGATVSSITNITFTFPDVTTVGYDWTATPTVGSTAAEFNYGENFNEIIVTANVTKAGTYVVTIPAGALTFDNVASTKEITINLTVEPTTGINTVNAGMKNGKYLRNNRVVIVRDGKAYNANGTILK